MYREKENNPDMTDHGPAPFVTDLYMDALQNRMFRRTLWTGEHLQMTLMDIPVGGEIGLERHDQLDQFLQIEDGFGLVMMGQTAERLDYRQQVAPGYGVFVPAGTWHNLVNVGNRQLKLYSIYAPPGHPHGTVHPTKADADAQEHPY